MAHHSDNPKKYGDPIPHDPDFSGPLKHRSCTDILCLLLFVVFIGCWAGIGIYAFKNGDPSTILIPRDSNGLRCGVDSPVADRPYLFFFNILDCVKPSVPFLGCPTPQVCVKECPKENYYNKINGSINIDAFCDDPSLKQSNEKLCPSWFLKSAPVQKRCIPVLSESTIHWVKDVVHLDGDLAKSIENIKLITDTEELALKISDDLIDSWPTIVLGLVFALFVTLVYILMLRWTAGIMVWLSIFGVIIALSFGTYASSVYYKKMLDEEKGMDGYTMETFHNFRKYFWLTALIICSVMLLIILLTTIFLRKRISLAITLIEEGSKAISSVTSVLCFPVFPWILQIGVIIFSLSVGVLLTTTGTPIYTITSVNPDSFTNPTSCQLRLNDSCSPDKFRSMAKDCPGLACKLMKIGHSEYYSYMYWLNIFGFFWGTCFVSALGQMILASVFATWYWTKPRCKLPFFAVTSSTLSVLRYHLGTLAFGSLIIAVCQVIRLILEYIDRKLKKYDNELTKAILCLLKCFFWCLEKFLKFINTNAYIMCAIHGKNFCTSARDAFMLLMRNILRVFVLDKVTDFLFFISSILISIGVGVGAYFLFATDVLGRFHFSSNLNYVEVPIVAVVIFTYFISRIFFSVFSMAVDTLFLCFLEDCERNDGTPEKPYFMSKDLMKIFGRKNKFE